jgi:hypothetical protein
MLNGSGFECRIRSAKAAKSGPTGYPIFSSPESRRLNGSLLSQDRACAPVSSKDHRMAVTAEYSFGNEHRRNTLHATMRFFAELETFAVRDRGGTFASVSEILGASNS